MRDSDAYKQKVSDARSKIDSRLYGLQRSQQDSSPKSNPVGNSADLNAEANYSPDKSGAQSASPNAKVKKRTVMAKSNLDNLADKWSVLPIPQ